MSATLPPPPKPGASQATELRSPDEPSAQAVPGSRAAWEAQFSQLMAAQDWAGALRLTGQAEATLGAADARLHHQTGHVLMKLGRAQEAYARFSSALKLVPTSVEIRLSIADAYLALQDRWSASAWLSDAIRVAPDRAATWLALGQVLAASERLDEWLQLAATAQERGLADTAMGVALANEWLRRRQFEAAARVLQALVEGTADVAPAERARWHLHLGFCREQQLALAACVESYRQALLEHPNLVEAHINLAGVLWRLGDFGGSRKHAEHATQLAPEHPHAWRIRGTSLMHLNLLAQAEPWLRGALQRQPQFPYATLDLALLKLLAGEWLEGWALYRLRWQDVHRIPRPAFWQAALEWQGPLAQPVNGRTVLVYGEQGLGDMIQFVRWIALLVAQGAVVQLVAAPVLSELLQSFAQRLQGPGRLQVVQAGDEVRFDWHVAMLDLPFHYQVDPTQDEPPLAYLRADAERVAYWRDRLAADEAAVPHSGSAPLRVGLAWAGSDRHPNNNNRSMTLSQLAPLWQCPGVRCHSLQKVPSPAWTDVPPDALAAVQWQDHTEAWRDFADSAAYVANLDLVITVDSAVAHLAAALGKPTWVLLPPNADWRWQLEGETTVWYRSVRLFRRAHGETPTPEAQVALKQAQVTAVLQALQACLAEPVRLARAASGANFE